MDKLNRIICIEMLLSLYKNKNEEKRLRENKKDETHFFLGVFK